MAFSTFLPLDGLVKDVAGALMSHEEKLWTINVRQQSTFKNTWINKQINIYIIYTLLA